MNPVTLVFISALSDFFITGGGVLLGGNLEGGKIPAAAVWIAAGVGGLIAFFKEVKQQLTRAQNTPRPPNGNVGGAGGLPTGKLLVLLAVLTALALTGCATVPYAAMSPEQIRELAKIKDASVAAVCGYYAGAKVTTVMINVDKGIPAGVIVDDCKVTFEGSKPAPAPR